MSAILRNIPIALTAVIAVAFAACGGGGESVQVVTDEQMAKMVLAKHQYGPDVHGFAPLPSNGPQTIDGMANADFDPTEERGDLERSGFERAYDVLFTGDPALGGGVYIVRSGVLRFASESGAMGYFDDSVGDLNGLTGRTSPHGYSVNEATVFDTGSPLSSGAHIITTHPDGSVVHVTQMISRDDRLVSYVSIATFGGEFDRPTAQGRIAGLMAIMDQQVQLVLAGADAQNQDGAGPLYVSNATDALGKSADQFDDKVESVSGDFAMQLTGATFNANMTGNFAFKEPEAMFMKFAMTGTSADAANPGANLSFDGLEVQFLYRDDKFYMLTPFTGWVYGDPDDLDIDEDEIEDLLDGGGPIDYSGMLDDLGDIEDLGIEQTEAGPMRHYRLTMDVAELIEAIGGVAAEEALPADDMTGATTFDIWLYSDNLLPHHFEATGQIASHGEAVNFAMQMGFQYGETVVIPEPPADAKPIDEAFGDLEFSFEGELEQAQAARTLAAAGQ